MPDSRSPSSSGFLISEVETRHLYKDGDGDWIAQGLHIILGTYSEFETVLEEIGRPPDEVFRKPGGGRPEWVGQRGRGDPVLTSRFIELSG
jgi:hypothetical protein